jgi:cytoskeletal protein CcmA (bactofilin family)
MRGTIRALALLWLAAASSTRLAAQQTTDTTRARSATPAVQPSATPQPTASAGQPALAGAALDSARALLQRLRQDPERPRIPADDSVTFGPRTIAAGSTVPGPVVVAGGQLDVFGTIEGDAVASGGDVVIHAGARVTGDAVAAGGRVRLEGGTVSGEMRSVEGIIGAAPVVPAAEAEERRQGSTTWHNVSLAFAWMTILTLIGIGTLVLAGGYLDGVVESLEGNFSRALLVGIGAQLAIVPALFLLIVALALTILGILLIPFAVVAFVLAVAGLLTLGFLGAARVTGESLAGRDKRRLSARGASLRALVLGVWLYVGLWLVAALFTWSPVLFGILRGVALAATWVAMSAGLGAAVLSRGGSRRATLTTPASAPGGDLSWETPTPITGVVAARRPKATVSGGSGRG